MRPSSDDCRLLVWFSIACDIQKFSGFCFFFLIQGGADLRMESFSCKESLHTFLPAANGFTFLTRSHWMLRSMFLFFNFQTLSLSVVEVLLSYSLKDALRKLNLVLNPFSVNPIYFYWLFEVVSVTLGI